MDYAAEMDRILAEYTAASRTVTDRFLAADARTTREGAAVFDSLRQRFEPEPEPPVQAVRPDPEPQPRRSGRETYVLPSDWTEEDEARSQGYGSPNSWLV
ncbi:hypothetical protein [Nocardia pseudobrasiliensis]|uniref:Uncharacterized protein n=1 Tax=Nocardia pseudobrasiliensis TaxID=45979 RepID=A0A370I787_9NOCA|nr:hypothetical protein [Nocardia pseudobrasiliensis]RDI66588.1 hypothetical protein DFR76_104338 [Nocardia pseudobrasiliensis]